MNEAQVPACRLCCLERELCVLSSRASAAASWDSPAPGDLDALSSTWGSRCCDQEIDHLGI